MVVPTSGIVRPVSAARSARPFDVGGLALVGAHAERRVALHVLDRAVAFAHRRARRRWRSRRSGNRRRPCRRCRTWASSAPRRADPQLRRQAANRERPQIPRLAASAPSQAPSARQLHQRKVSHGGAPHRHAGRRRCGDECVHVLAPAGPVAEMAGKMQRRIPAVRHREQVAGDVELLPGSVAYGHSGDERCPRAPSRPCRRQWCARRIRTLSRVRARVDHGSDADARIRQVLRRAPAVVTRGKDDGAPARSDSKAIDVRAHGATPA